MFRNWTIVAVSALWLVLDAPTLCRAGVTFLGPTPYLSKADSPFPVDGSNPNFLLEDFEDGSFIAPGIVLPSDPNARGVVLSAGQLLTNSVDADDGQIDGMGRNGRALMSSVYTTNLVDPPTINSYISLLFDVGQLGFLPTAFGFVWTYGRQNSVVRMDVFDGNANEIGYSTFVGIGNGTDNDTLDDRFLGVRSSEGIGGVLITSSYPGDPWFFEIDHVQYGLQVPEPLTISMLIVSALVVVWHASFSRPVPSGRKCFIPVMSNFKCNSFKN
jgi:hypothetical protein